MQILAKLGKGASCSLLLLTQSSQAFGTKATGGANSLLASQSLFKNNSIRRSTSNKKVYTPTKMSSTSTKSASIAHPDPVVVQPGTSPVETQETLNPIDQSCTILIIGATRGIGLEFVNQCLEKGAKVIGTHRGTDVPEGLEKLQKNHPESMFCLTMDVADEGSIQNAVVEYKALVEKHPDIIKESKGLTHIIHSAGVYLPGTSFDGSARGPRQAAPAVTKETMMKTFEINTIAPLLVAQNFVPLLSKRSEKLLPVLSFLTSKVGSIDDNGSGGAYAYRSSKSALNNIAKSLSIDLAGEASVTLLHPGYVRTDMTSGNGLIDVDESVSGMLKAVEATDATVGFRFVDYKACLIPW